MTDIIAAIRLKHGADYPFDAPDNWWRKSKHPKPPPADDWAHAAARGVIADLQDRGGIKYGFIDVDEDTRQEIVRSLADIIRLAHYQALPTPARP